MTAPNTGGRTFTVAPGKAAQLLTQSAPGGDDPLVIINSDVTGCRVWVASGPEVGPSDGVPLDAGTSIPWTTPGQVWVVADPAGTAAATVVITTGVDNWQPSPVAIAAQVAAQLLAQGIPNTLIFKTIIGSRTPTYGVWDSYDVSQYASIVIDTDPNNIPTQLQYRFLDPIGGPLDSQSFGTFPLVVPVLGPTLQVQIPVAGSPGAYAVYGSNRPSGYPHVKQGAAFQSKPWHGTSANQARVANAGYIVVDSSGLSVPTGQCYAFFTSSGTTVGGVFRALTSDGKEQRLMDTGLMGLNYAGTSKVQNAMVAIPEDTTSISFLCTIAGTNAIDLWLTPAY